SVRASRGPVAPAAPTVLLPATVVQLWEPGVAGEYRPALLAKGRARYRDARKGIEHAEEVVIVAALPIEGEEIDWRSAQLLGRPTGELRREPPAGAVLAALPETAGRAGAWRAWGWAFKRDL